MTYKGDYMPNAYVVGDSVRFGGDFWVCIQDVNAGAPAPVAPYWEKAVDVPALSDEFPASVGEFNNAGTGTAAARWDHVHAAPVPPDMSAYARKDGAAFTGTVTAPGLAPDAGASVRNTFFLTAAPPDTLGNDGDLAVVL
jgi:hypothetical protein